MVTILPGISFPNGLTPFNGITFSNFSSIPIPTQMQAASRLNQMGFNGYTGSDGIDTDSNTKIFVYNQTGTGVTKVKLVFPNWYATSTNESAGYNTITVTASFAGQQVLFGGSASGTIPAGSTLTSDELTLNSTWANAAQATIISYVSVTSGQKWVQGYLINTASGELCDFSTGVDKTMSGTIVNATPSATRRGYGPIGVLATAFTGIPVKRSFASLGDSILMGSGDGNFDSVGNTGWNGRGMSGIFPHVNMAIAGTNAQNNVTANLTRRIAAMQAMGITDVLCDYHNNDIAGLSTYNQITGYISDITNGLKGAGLRVHYSTPLPYTTGTYLTAAGQTIYATNSGYLPEGNCRYSQIADYVRANTMSANGVIDIQAPIAVNSSNVITKNGGYWISGNGGVGATSTHLTTSGAATDGATDDGRHPNVKGTSTPFYGGHYILKDTLTTYLNGLPN